MIINSLFGFLSGGGGNIKETSFPSFDFSWKVTDLQTNYLRRVRDSQMCLLIWYIFKGYSVEMEL